MINKKTIRGHKRNKSFRMKPKCSVNIKKRTYTCYKKKSLRKLRDLWNERHPDIPILSQSSKYIWNALKTNMKDVCKNEMCWLKQNFAKNKLDSQLSYYTFSPEAPASWTNNPNEWLSSIDIEKVMRQYEKEYKDFEFMGPSPIDFDKRKMYGECVWNELCNISLTYLRTKGTNKVGIIFNLDPHYKRGSHWVSLFIDMHRKYIHYFDSTGDSSPKEIKVLINKLKAQGKSLGINFKTIINTKEHQKENTECGMYSLYLIIESLKGKTPEHFSQMRVTDKQMELLRYEYFNFQ